MAHWPKPSPRQRLELKLAMSAEEPGKTESGQDGLRFAATLSDCLLSGVIMLNGAGKIETVTAGAAQMLGLAAGAKNTFLNPPSPPPKSNSPRLHTLADRHT